MKDQPTAVVSYEHETRLRAAWAELTSGEQEEVRDRFGLADSPDKIIEQAVYDVEPEPGILKLRNAVRASASTCSGLWAAVLSEGPDAWIFEPLAERLSQVLGWPIVSSPSRLNYVLAWEGAEVANSFVPFEAMRIASDKRLVAHAFSISQVPTPETLLPESEHDLQQVLALRSHEEWVLKWPTGCGGVGHRIIASGDEVPPNWPRPFVLQKFIRLERPEVFRLYAVGGELFGWNVRRFTSGASASPFVAHARGARYEDAGEAPAEAEAVARAALRSCELLGSFGCADLMRDSAGRWLALEVNTDGVFQHVDRDVPEAIAREIEDRLARAIWDWAERES